MRVNGLQPKRLRGRAAATALGVAIVLALPGGLAAQDVRETLFRDTDQVLAEAKEARADILAPESFNQGMRHYREAERNLERGRDLRDIRRELDRATQYFRKATEATALANVTLKAALAARDDAVEAEAAKYAAQDWVKGRDKFSEAASKLEDGDINGARRRAEEAERLFRTAELAAIKANYLNETWQLLEYADQMKVDDRAPKTLKLAQGLVSQAERQLTENRYDSDEPRALAQEAKREARHAVYLASKVEELRRAKPETLEDHLLSMEEPMRSIAGSMELAVTFEEGFEQPTQKIITRVQAYQDTIQALRSALSGREEMVAALDARVSELQEQLGGVQEERSALAQRMEAQARLQQRFSTVELMFTRDQARVVREADDVILRLHGLSFPVGRATIEPEYFPLLTKVQQAIRTFPNARVTIEGHTDSFGGDEANQTLSQERAIAVRQYLLANMDFDPSLMEAMGYGETRPVASNETKEGRARNRRIDVVIHPQLDASF